MIVVPCSDNVNPIYLQTTTLLGHHYSGPRCDSSIHQNKDFDINVGSVLSFSLLGTLNILYSSNHNIHNSSYSLRFWASDPLIDRFYYDLLIKGSEAQKQRPQELL